MKKNQEEEKRENRPFSSPKFSRALSSTQKKSYTENTPRQEGFQGTKKKKTRFQAAGQRGKAAREYAVVG